MTRFGPTKRYTISCYWERQAVMSPVIPWWKTVLLRLSYEALLVFLFEHRHNRRFSEKKTGEIIRKIDAPAVGHHFRHGLLAYIAVEKLWSVTVSDLQAWTYTILDCQMRARNTFFFLCFSAYYGLFGGATCGVSVWNGGLTESTAGVHYLHHFLD